MFLFHPIKYSVYIDAKNHLSHKAYCFQICYERRYYFHIKEFVFRILSGPSLLECKEFRYLLWYIKSKIWRLQNTSRKNWNKQRKYCYYSSPHIIDCLNFVCVHKNENIKSQIQISAQSQIKTLTHQVFYWGVKCVYFVRAHPPAEIFKKALLFVSNFTWCIQNCKR